MWEPNLEFAWVHLSITAALPPLPAGLAMPLVVKLGHVPGAAAATSLVTCHYRVPPTLIGNELSGGGHPHSMRSLSLPAVGSSLPRPPRHNIAVPAQPDKRLPDHRFLQPSLGPM